MKKKYVEERPRFKPVNVGGGDDGLWTLCVVLSAILFTFSFICVGYSLYPFINNLK